MKFDDFWRVCPRCGHSWKKEVQWMNDTTECGAESRSMRWNELGWHGSFKELTEFTATVHVRMRIHDCGGRMYDEGTVTGQRATGKQPVLEVVR